MFFCFENDDDNDDDDNASAAAEAAAATSSLLAALAKSRSLGLHVPLASFHSTTRASSSEVREEIGWREEVEEGEEDDRSALGRSS